MANSTFKEINNLINKSNNICTISHIRPDGDAIGSQLAISYYLEEIGKKVIPINQDGAPEYLDFLESGDYLKDDKYLKNNFSDIDLIICVDISEFDRVGDKVKNIIDEKLADVPIINFDHHISNPGFGKLNYIEEESSSAAEIIYLFLSSLNKNLSKKINEAIYVGILTDTGSFRFSRTTSRVFNIAEKITSSGVDISKIASLIYDRQPLRKIKLQGKLISELNLALNNKIAYFLLDLNTKKELNIISQDTEGLIAVVRSIIGVVGAIFFDQVDENTVRISMRSKDLNKLDVCEVCTVFGGGGHSLASGLTFKGSLKEAEKEVIKVISEKLND